MPSTGARARRTAGEPVGLFSRDASAHYTRPGAGGAPDRPAPGGAAAGYPCRRIAAASAPIPSARATFGRTTFERSRTVPSPFPDRRAPAATSHTPGIAEHDFVFGQTANMTSIATVSPALTRTRRPAVVVHRAGNEPSRMYALTAPLPTR